MYKIKDGTKIVGIDSSTSCSGVSLFEVKNNKLVLIKCSKIIPKSKIYQGKCNEIYNYINSDFISNEKPDYVFIELLNSFKNGNTTRILSGLWGFLLGSFWRDSNIGVISLNTATVKKTMTGEGSADKQKVIKFVNKMFNLKLVYNERDKEVSGDDIADSIAVAYCGFMKLKNGETFE